VLQSIDLIRREPNHDVEVVILMWFDTLNSVKVFMSEGYEAGDVPAQEVLTDFNRLPARYQVLDRREQPL
jgi:hypothetical protein